MTREPLRSNLSIGEITETSLALPSDGHSHSGQRRVMEQVSTMRKSRRKYSSKGSAGTLSPTSPKSDSVLYESKLASPQNGSDLQDSIFTNGHTKMWQHKQGTQKSVSTKSANYYRIYNNNILPNSLPALTQPNPHADLLANQGAAISSNTMRWGQNVRQLKSLVRSHSQPPLTNPVQMKMNNTSNQLFGSNTIIRRTPSAHSNPEPKLSMASKSKGEMTQTNGEANKPDMPIKEAVQWLTQGDENMKLYGASVIQHKTFTDDEAKEEVRSAHGIAPLLSLLKNDNPEIELAAASALRNLVFKNSDNKKVVRRLGGLTMSLNLLQRTESVETQKHITGLLWNLSSEEIIHPEMLRESLQVLTSTVLQPYKDFSDISLDFDARTESFCNATGCLRNLSSGRLPNRVALRSCKGLIDSLFIHLTSSLKGGVADSKSVENCVCVLHNLTYQLEMESSNLFEKLTGRSNTHTNTDTGPIGCFSNQSRRIQPERYSDFQLLQDTSNPKDQERLIHTETMQMYLNLLSKTQNEKIKEACCGALHNLTAKKGFISDVFSYTIVRKLQGIEKIAPHLYSENIVLRNNVITLTGNLARNPALHEHLAGSAVLPGIFKVLKSDLTPESDSSAAVACHTATNLVRANPEKGKKFLTSEMVNILSGLTENSTMPKSTIAAGVFLHSLWSDRTLQGHFKKNGMSKTVFVNEITSEAFKSLQIIE